MHLPLWMLFLAAAVMTPVFAQPVLPDGLYAKLETNKGDIILRLEYRKTPMTVANFVGLIEGTKDSNKDVGVPFYDGISFHRVIDNFMVQGGDPDGTGRGGPGYSFPDEIDQSLKHDAPGVLSMANAGPDTNGSQFFITHKATPWLNGKHTVFGRVDRGLDVVNAIRQGDTIKKATIIRQGSEANAFKADQASFDSLVAALKSKARMQQEKTIADYSTIVDKRWPDAVTTSSGLKFIRTREGSGSKPSKGTTVTAHYTGTLLGGKKFDSSVDRGQPFQFPVGMGRVIKGWDEAFLDMKKGEKRTIIIPPELGYGSKGAGGVIPPNATLVFDVELVDF